MIILVEAHAMLGDGAKVDGLLEELEDVHIGDEFVLHRPQFAANPLLTDAFALSHFAIFNPAVNSSGDVYHIAAYLMLCREFNWIIPKVYIGADTQDTLAQAKRACDFLGLLGFANDVEILPCDKPVIPQASPRALEIRKKLKSKRADAIDQKMTTALLLRASLQLGCRMNAIMREGFLSSPWRAIDQEHSKLIHDWLDQKIRQIVTAVGQSPFIVIHHRRSDNSNSGQTLSQKALGELVKFFKNRYIQCFCFRISDKQHKSKKRCVDVFEPVDKLSSKHDKFRHIQLLHAVSCMNGFLGVVGGTSGTLDVAAFMGIRVFNIHKFTKKSRQPADLIPYQDYRILLQVQFMTVCRALTSEEGVLDKQAAIFLSQWLGDIAYHRTLLFVEGRTRYIEDDPDEHNDRIPFKHCVLSNEEGDEAGRICINRPSGDLHVAPANRFFEQQKNWLEDCLKISSFHNKATLFKGVLSEPNKKYSKDDFDCQNILTGRKFFYEAPF